MSSSKRHPGLRRKRVSHICIGCGRVFPHEYTTVCQCGQMIEVYYDLEQATLYDSPNPYERYFDILPLEDPEKLLPVDQSFTPCRHAEQLGRELGLEKLYLKNETVLPTGSTKDRMATVALSFMQEVGASTFATSSTGNSSTAFASYLHMFPEGRLFLFSGEDFLSRLAFTRSHQLTVYAMRDATFVEACDEAKDYAVRKGLVAERGFFNPGRREGLKTALLEALEQVPEPIDWYVQAVSSAMGLYGAYKGACELQVLGRIDRPPRLLGVQQQTNPPMVTAFEAGSDVIRPQDIVPRPTGIASAILRGNPSGVYPYVRKQVLESEGLLTAVSETEIREARKMVEELEDISPCFTASTAMAGLIRAVRLGKVPRDHTILVNLTGRDRGEGPDEGVVTWLKRGPDNTWVPEDPSLPGAQSYQEKA